MAQRDGITAGWRLFSAWAETALPTRSRRIVVLAGIGVSLVASAGAAVLFRAVDLVGGGGGGSGGAAPVATALASLFAGSGVGSIAAAALLFVARRRLVRVQRQAEGITADEAKASRWRFRGSGVPAGGGAEIRAAWLEGSEPGVPIPQRLAAVQSARGARTSLPALVLSSLAAIPFWASGAGFFVTVVVAGIDVNFAGAIAPVYLVLFGGQALPYLHALGRTTAPIETAPAVPDNLNPDGRKKRVPHTPLGTDHPDDYR